MRTPTYRNRTDISENMMTSMIDIVFLLLIFFVCAAARAGGLLESLLPTSLTGGTVESSSPMDPPPLGDLTIKLRLDVSAAVEMELNGRVHSDFESLRQTLLELAKIAPEIPVVLHTEPDVPVRELIRVYDTCQAAHFRDIRFATRQKPTLGKIRR